MNQLIDGDLANNNGGWQWSASTGKLLDGARRCISILKLFIGVDPQPYFRIFNPTLQSEKVCLSAAACHRFDRISVG